MRRFLIVAFGLAWLFTAPLWVSGAGLDSPMVQVTGAAMMFTPSLAALAVVAAGRRSGRRSGTWAGWRAVARDTGLTLGPRPRRTAALIAVAWLGVPVLVVVAAAISVALGLLTLDLDEFSAFTEQLRAAGGGPLPMPVGVLVLLTMVGSLTIGTAVTTLFALGEEWGWRGWMLPRLVATRGVTAGLLISGVIWGLWHFPLTLRGYNYPELGPWAAGYFIGFCVLFSVPIGWLRLMSGSVWPAAVAHASLNSTAGLVLLVGDAADPPLNALAGITGLVGWAVLAVVSVVALRHLRGCELPGAGPDRDQRAAADTHADTDAATDAGTMPAFRRDRAR